MYAPVRLPRFITIALLALASALTATAGTIDATVFSVSGDAQFAAPGSNHFAPMTKGQTLPVGTTVRTGDNGVAVLVTTPGSAVQVGNDSVSRFPKEGDTIQIRKGRLGGFLCDVTQYQSVRCKRDR